MATSPGQLTGRFFYLLLAVNRPRLDGFKHWLFHPGMLFQSRQQWWGDEKPRSNPHEGLDLCWFKDVGGNRQSLDHTTVIPIPFPGTIVKISRDFLGQSIFVAHDILPEPDRRLYTALGHTSPRPGLAVGQKVLECQAARSKADMLLKALFDPRPAVINVQEHTTVRYPESLYDAFVNSYQEEVTPAWKSDLPFLRAYRPRNTYYRGLHSDGDVQDAGLPMQPEISVVSTVRLYFESPAASRPKK